MLVAITMPSWLYTSMATGLFLSTFESPDSIEEWWLVKKGWRALDRWTYLQVMHPVLLLRVEALFLVVFGGLRFSPPMIDEREQEDANKAK
jgi:hypothetical protein